MTTPEAARLDLYNGLSDLLGPSRADTLMTYLPHEESDDLARRSGVEVLKTDVRVLRSDVDVLKTDMTELKSDLKHGLTALNQRMDRLFVTLVAGLLTIVAAMAGVLFTVA